MNLYLRTLLLIITFSGLISCKRTQKIPTDTLVIGIPSAPPTLDPRYARDSVGSNIRSLLFSSLVKVQTEENSNTIAIVGDLAESWTYKNLIYRFQLRKGIQFSDGRPLTAVDIEFSFKEYQKDLCPFSSAFKKIKLVKAAYDSYEQWVEIHVARYESTFLLDLAVLHILPKSEVIKHDQDFYDHLLGTGAFRMLSQNDNELVLEAVPNHYKSPKVKTILFKVVRDDNTRFQKLYKGSLDLVQADVPLSKLTIFKNSPRFNVYEMPGANITYLLLNQRDKLLKNKQVREAINLAIDRAEIIKYKMEGYAQPASTLVIPNTPYYSENLLLPDTDLEKAKQLIASLEKPIELELKTSNQKYAIENGRILAHQIEKLGISVKMKSFEWGTYYSDITKGNYQLATMKFVGVWDPDIYRLVFHSEELAPKGMNRSFYINKSLDQALEQGNQIENVPQRIAHYKKIQKIIMEDLPIIPLWYDQYIAVVNRRVKNFVPSPLGNFNFVYNVEKTADE